MKATQYAALITELVNPTNQELLSAIGKMGKDFYNEYVHMARERKVGTLRGNMNLIREFDIKFKKVAELVNKKFTGGAIQPDGFLNILTMQNSTLALEYERFEK